MTGYRMACPIARALDRVGDRWTLLMLRDLHAGPMRFGELRAGLPSLATNLLSTRLDQLQTAGLVAKDGPWYSLTEHGRATDRVLWELAKLGMAFPPDPDLRPVGHLRLLAVTLQSALRQIDAGGRPLVAHLVVDGESFVVDLTGEPTVTYGAVDEAAVEARTDYSSLMAAAGGELSLDAFRAGHVEVTGGQPDVAAFVEVMTRVMTEAFAASLEPLS